MGSLSRTHTHISQVLQPWVVSFQLCIIFFHSHLICVLSQFSYHAKDGKNLKYIHTWFWLPSSSITCVQWNKETKTTGRVHRAGVTGQRPDGKTHVQILPETKYPLLKSRAEGCYLLQFRFFSHHPDSWIPQFRRPGKCHRVCSRAAHWISWLSLTHVHFSSQSNWWLVEAARADFTVRSVAVASSCFSGLLCSYLWRSL